MSTVIQQATEKDANTIVHIGLRAVELSHRNSCSVEDMNEFLDSHYNEESIGEELADPKNNYHIIYHNGQPAGFSKIIFNFAHPDIPEPNVTKLDRIYLLEEFYDLKLGFELLNFNIELSKRNGQSGMWLFTWTGNTRAVSFYKRNGFVIIGDHKFKVSDTHYNPNHHMLRMYK